MSWKENISKEPNYHLYKPDFKIKGTKNKINVAIHGCSHSEYTEATQGYYIKLLAEKFPNINFWNFAEGGHGTLNQLYTWQFAKHFCPVKFDHNIIQMTGWNRWQIPVNHTHMFNTFKVLEQSSNLYQVVNMAPRLITVTVFNYDDMSFKNGYFADRNIDKTDEPGFKLVSMASDYSLMFLKMISLDNDVSYFNYRPTFSKVNDDTNNSIRKLWDIPWDNLGYDQIVENWFIEKYGWEGYAHLLDDTLHLNKEGNTILFEEFIMKSNLGKKLLDLSNI